MGRRWRAAFSPYGQVSQIPPQEVQAYFREVMAQWGRPQRIRVDNGVPWGKGQELPSALALWWMGLGIEVVWIPPGKPQYNGVVERAQGVLQQWAEPHTWQDFQSGQARLAWAVEMQREGYRGKDGKTRLERYPELRTAGRPYRPEEEAAIWSLAEVDRRLATGSWKRKVGKTGQISLYNWAYSVGRQYARQQVFLRWDAQKREWQVRDERGDLIKTLKPKQFDAQAICNLNIAYVKPSRRKRGTKA